MAKHNHNERFERYVTEENGGFWPPQTPEEKLALANLCNELIGIDTPAIIHDRNCDAMGKAYVLENSPELYGRTLRQTRQKYMGDIRACHVGRNDCDVEMEEQDKAIIGATLHSGDVEKPL
jgi:hypothetical protein